MKRTTTPTIAVRSDGDEHSRLQAADELLRAEGADRRIEDLRQSTVGDHQGEAAPGDEQPERGDDRLDPHDSDEHAVERSGEHPDDQRGDDGDRRAVVEGRRERRRSEGHRRPDGEIDAGGGHDDRHAEGDDHDGRHLDELQPDVVQRGEVRREQQIEGDDDTECGVHAVRPQADPRTPVPGDDGGGRGHASASSVSGAEPINSMILCSSISSRPSSPTTVPRLSTTTRVEPSTTSSSSDEMSTMPRP